MRVYGRVRSSIERVNSRLEDLISLNRHRVRGLGNIAMHVALCIIVMLLVTLATLSINILKKARSIASFV